MQITNPLSTLSVETYGLILMLLSAVFFSCMGTFVKLAGETGFPSTELVFYRAIFQGVLVLFYMCRYTDTSVSSDEEQKLLILEPFGKTKEVIPTVICRGVMGALNFTFKFYAIMSLPLGDAITLFSLHPIITVYMAWLFLDEKIRPSHIFAALATITGAVLMAGPTFLFNDDGDDEEVEIDKLGYLTAILGSFSAAGVLVLIRKAGNLGVHTTQLLFSFTVFGSLLAIIIGMTIGLKIEGMWVMPPSAKSYWFLFGMCGIGSIGQLLLNYAGRLAPAGLGSIARSSDILWGYILEVIVFHEIPSWTTLVGVILILIALITVAYEKVKDEYKLIRPSTNNVPGEDKGASIEMRYKSMDEIIPQGVQA
mmetsp:Transcript_12686/g.14318  ORF Transcript_12686/g.14318 Transcript_12686/m.14318 type:complete len:367 (+) Transcript_12686:72-1172(+)